MRRPGTRCTPLRRYAGVAALAALFALAAAAVLIARPTGDPSKSNGHAPSTNAAGKENVGVAPRAGESALRPSGGYVVSPRGSLLADESGRTIETFVLPLECGHRPLVVGGVAVSGASFTFAGNALGDPAIVRLEGRILDARRIRGVVVAEGQGCPSRPVTFLARLS